MSEKRPTLPGVLGEIELLVGIDAAVAVADAVGGTRAYIARRPDANHWLVRAVGPEHAAVIVDHFTTSQTGAAVDFPVGPNGSYKRQRRQRAQQMATLTGQGLSIANVARKVGVSERAVSRFRARRRERGDDPQGDLGF